MAKSKDDAKKPSLRFDQTEFSCLTIIRTVAHLARDNAKMAIANGCSLEKKLPGLTERLLKLADDAEAIREEANRLMLAEANARMGDLSEIKEMFWKGP